MILRFLLALLLIPSLCFAVVNNPLDTTTLSADVITTGTVQAEHLTSTDDADIVDNLTAGDMVIDEAAGVLNFSGATSGTISTASTDLTLAPHTGQSVVISGATSAITANEATLTITATDSITLATTDIITDSVSTRIDSVVLADEATFNLPTSSTGILNIFVEGDNESATCDIQDAGTVTVRSATGPVVNTDTDTNLCIITGANPVVIKNHLGSEKTICYNYLYK